MVPALARPVYDAVIDRAAVVALLEERGAGTTLHPGGTLLEHLQRVADLLGTWAAREELVIAGLTHAAYGTDGFNVAPLRLGERGVFSALIGRDAEAIVYRYASCDRAYTLGQLGRQGAVVMRDRFTADESPLEGQALRDFAELTFANELDLARHSEEFRRDYGPAIAPMFARWQQLVTEAAYMEFVEQLGGGVAGGASR